MESNHQAEKPPAPPTSLKLGRVIGILIAVVGILGIALSIDAFFKGGDEAGAVAGLGPGFFMLMLTGGLLALGYRLGLWLSYLWVALGAYPIFAFISEWSPDLLRRNTPEIVLYTSFELVFLTAVVYFQRRFRHLHKLRFRWLWRTST